MCSSVLTKLKVISLIKRALSASSVLVLMGCSIKPVLEPVETEEQFEVPAKIAVMLPGPFNTYLKEMYYGDGRFLERWYKQKIKFPVVSEGFAQQASAHREILLYHVRASDLIEQALSESGLTVVEPDEADYLLVWGDYYIKGSKVAAAEAQMALGMFLIPLTLGVLPYGCFDYDYMVSFHLFKKGEAMTLIDQNISRLGYKQCWPYLWGQGSMTRSSSGNINAYIRIFSNLVDQQILHLQESYVVE